MGNLKSKPCRSVAARTLRQSRRRDHRYGFPLLATTTTPHGQASALGTERPPFHRLAQCSSSSTAAYMPGFPGSGTCHMSEPCSGMPQPCCRAGGNCTLSLPFERLPLSCKACVSPSGTRSNEVSLKASVGGEAQRIYIKYELRMGDGPCLQALQMFTKHQTHFHGELKNFENKSDHVTSPMTKSKSS